MLLLERAKAETTALWSRRERRNLSRQRYSVFLNTYLKESNVFFIYLGDSGDEAEQEARLSAAGATFSRFFPPSFFILLG